MLYEHSNVQWRQAGYKGVTETTRLLLNYWFRNDHRLPNGCRFEYYYAQREAIETLVYLYEVAGALPALPVLPLQG